MADFEYEIKSAGNMNNQANGNVTSITNTSSGNIRCILLLQKYLKEKVPEIKFLYTVDVIK